MRLTSVLGSGASSRAKSCSTTLAGSAVSAATRATESEAWDDASSVALAREEMSDVRANLERAHGTVQNEEDVAVGA